MPPSKSNAGKRETRGRMGASTAAPAAPARGRMGGCQNGIKTTGMKSAGMKVTGMRMSGMKGSGMKVTGMKGRMGGSSAANGQRKIPFKAVKGANKKRQKKISPESILSGNKQQDEALLKLRIPLDICCVLPSIKKFTAKKKGTKGRQQKNNMYFQTVAEADQEQYNPKHPRFAKKRKTDYAKYNLTWHKEERFQGMIWDVAFTTDGDIIVTSSEGATLCDKDMKIKKNFPNMFLPGAIGFLSDGRVLIVDRSSDTVNVYRKNATFIRSFLAGKCPMGLVVTENDEVLVSDTGDKCVHKFDMLGRHLMTIPTKGEDYHLRWPLYLALTANQDIIVSDVHQQKVLQFSNAGQFLKVLPLKTQGGSSVIRPHGVCVTRDDELLVIDTSIDSLEGFFADGSFMQNILNPDDGVGLEPKLCKLNKEHDLIVIGGMKGLIRIYELSIVPEPTPSSKSKGAAASSSQSSAVKSEVKEEPMDH